MYSDLLFEYFQIFESPTKDTVYILFIILLLKYLLYFIYYYFARRGVE